MTDPQIPAEGASIVYRTQSAANSQEPTMTESTPTTPTIPELLGAFLRLACELRSDYCNATAAQTAALNRLAAAIEDATDAQVLNA